MKLKAIGSIKKVFILLLFLVLLPALFYSAYEINSLSSNERVIGEIYRQQLEVVLFSLNRYSWDVVSTWAGRISAVLNETPRSALEQRKRKFVEVLGGAPSVRAVFVKDRNAAEATLYTSDGRNGSSAERDYVRELLVENTDKIDRLARLSQADYRKIEPLSARGDGVPARDLGLAFIPARSEPEPELAGILLDERAFIRDVLRTRMLEAAGDQFVIAVVEKASPDPVFATSAVAVGDLKQQKQLWLFPDLSLGIRLRGATIEDFVRERFYGNLVLIILLDVVLLAGAWVLYRSVRRELELVRLKSEFVSTVSHELRTPLALIRMFAETLEMGRIRQGPRLKEYHATILREAERLTRLVNNVLSFSRMEAGKKSYDLKRCDLNGVVSDVLGTYSFHVKSQGFAPCIDLDQHLPAILADSEAVSEALINVIDNAMKYGGKEKYLAVRTGQTAEGAFVEVEDHGLGIAQEHQKKVFDTFYRVTSGAGNRGGGTGLGLALVKRIMEAHHGSVTLVSVPGKGSTFRLLFPTGSAR